MEFKYLYWIFEEDLDYLICMFVVGFFVCVLPQQLVLW